MECDGRFGKSHALSAAGMQKKQIPAFAAGIEPVPGYTLVARGLAGGFGERGLGLRYGSMVSH